MNIRSNLTIDQASSIKGYFRGQNIRRGLYLGCIITCLGLTLFSLLGGFVSSQAASLTLSRDDLKAGAYQYNDIDITSDNKIGPQAGNKGDWYNDENIPLSLPDSTYYPEMAYGLNNTLYVLPGNYTGLFRRYWVDEKRWEDLKTMPYANFSKLIFDGSRYFYSCADVGENFYRYDSFTDDWEKLPAPPLEWMAGSNIEYVVKDSTAYIYALRGGSTGYFWRYSVLAGTWENLAPTTNLISAGSALSWDRGNFLYVIRGNYTYALYRFDLTLGTWAARISNSGCVYDVYKSSIVYLDTDNLMLFSYERMCKYTISTNTFTAINQAEYSRYDSRMVAFDGANKLYIGGSSYPATNLRVYDTLLNLWDPELKEGGGYQSVPLVQNIYSYYNCYAFDGVEWIYAIRGDNNTFYKKSIITGQVVGLSSLSGVMYLQYGCRMTVASNGKVYATRGYSTNLIYSYNIATNAWEWDPVNGAVPLLPTIPGTVYLGSDLIDGGDGYLYVVRGNGTNNMYRMNLSNNTWDSGFGGVNNYSKNLPSTVSSGGGSAKVGNQIVVFAGDSGNSYSSTATSRIFRYNITTSSWTEDKIGPMAVGNIQYNAAITSNNVDTVYLGIGLSSPNEVETSRRVYSYNVTSQVWTRLADMPNYNRGRWSSPKLFYFKDGSTGAETIYGLAGNHDNRLYSWRPTSDAYIKTSTYYSKRFDLLQVNALSTLNYTKTGAGSATIYTRTSDNLATWGNWNALSGNTIVTDPGAKRYFQFKIDFVSNGAQNPQVSNISFDYSQETLAPGQPDLLKGYSEKGGVQLETGRGYQYHHPYFSWNAASDGVNGSGVAGYYVYFGDQSNADPATVGSYQAVTDYAGDIPMQFEGGKVYYLRIKVKDKLGNISTATTHFSYIYQFVSPPEKVVVDTKSEFAEGTSTGLDISDADGKATLQKISNGTWSDGDLAKIPKTFAGGGATYANGSVYVITANSTNSFYRFDLSANQWIAIANVPELIPNSSSGSVLCFDGADTIYLIVGNGSLHYYKYEISKNIWTALRDLPVPAVDQSAMVRLDSNKFMVTLLYSSVNFIYDARQDTFEENAPAPGNFMAASNLYSKGDGVIYTLQEYNMLRKYVASENRWYSVGRAPSYLLGSQNIAFAGIGDNMYFFGMANSKNETAYRYNIPDNRFYPISKPNMEMYDTGYVVSDNNRYIYLFHNYKGIRLDNIFEKYDTLEDRYLPDLYTPQRAYVYNNPIYYDGIYGTETSSIFTTDTPASYVYDGVDKYYAKFNGSKIAEYSISQKKLLREFLIPYPSYGHLEILDGYLYLTSSSGNRFFKMSIDTQEWQELATTPGNLSITYSKNLVKDKEGRLYAQGGGNTKPLYMYTPETNIWVTLPNAPLNLGFGSQLIYDGSRYFYVLFGQSTASMRRFDTQTLTWDATVLASALGTLDFGTTAAIRQGKIYVLRGINTKTSFVYDIALNTWAAGNDAVTEVSYSASLLKITDDYALLFPSGSKSAVWRYNFPSDTNGNNALGVYQAKNFSIEGIFSYVNIEASVDLPINTAIDFQTRTSENGGMLDSNWTEWKDVTSIKINEIRNGLTAHINSPVKRNIQVRAILKSYDSYNKPTLSKLSVNYYNDITPPNNPTLAKMYTNTNKTTEVDVQNWSNNATPVLDWPEPGEMGGATDGLIGSNISKYYVYFGTDETAVPQTQGVLVTGTQYQPTLTAPGRYYFRMQTVDGADNVSSQVYAPIVYKFDNEKPFVPKKVEVNPSGYTRINNFSFKWPASIDNHSGVDQYCWRIGSDPTGVYFTERCQNTSEILNIPAGNQDQSQQGASVFYVRVKDAAGNYSESTQEATFYYYNSGAPTAPTNVTASPTSNSTNTYSFTWDPPSEYVGNVDKITYYYSINKLPNETNTIATTSRSVGPIPAATQLGSNTFYVVAKDEAGNVNWTMSSMANFDAATFAPGVPLNFDINDISSRVSSKWALALSWDAPENDAGRTDHYFIYRSTDAVRFSKLDSTNKTYYVDSGLEEGKTYYYQVSASDSIGKEGPKNPSQTTGMSGTPSGSFVAPPEVLSMSAGEDLKLEGIPKVPDSVGPNSPVILEMGAKNAVMVWRTNRACAGYVLFGKNGNINESAGSLEKTDIHVVKLTGLSADTSYSYKIQNFDQNRKYDMEKSISSVLYNFKTKSIPSIRDVLVQDTTIDQALIKFKADGLNSFLLQYGEGNQYGMYKAGDMGTYNNGEYSAVLDKLQSSTGYNFKIVVSTIDGDELSSDNYIFNTLAYPKISNVRVQPLDEDGNSYAVTWNTNVKTSSILSYQINADIIENKDDEPKNEHSMKVTGLLSGGEYTLVPKGKDLYGNMVIGESQKVKTGVDTKSPQITNLKIESSINANNKTAQLIMTWETDELATSQIEFGKITQGREKEYPSTSMQDNNLTKKHVVVVPNLELASTYHARALSYDATGNLARSEDSMAVVGRKEKTMIQKVVEVMANLFGWLAVD